MTYTDSPVNDVRKLLWSELQATGILNSSDYNVTGMGQIVPIVPIQQQKELVDKIKGKPFITYDTVTEYVEPGLWYVNCEQILLTVWAEDNGTASKIRNLMIDLFRRQDESARDLNEVTATDFGYLNVTIVSNRWTTPERSETGRLSFDMVIEVKYVRQLSSNGRYS